MSEAELHILRGRMPAVARNKARRGELFNHAPIGYARVPGGGLMLDPDEQARDVVRLVFDKFDELGTVSALLRYLAGNGIRLGFHPHFGTHKGELVWRRLNRTTLTFLLHHPVYAGAYSRGRRPTDPRRKVPGRPATGRVLVPREQWEVLIPGHLPGTSRGSGTRRTCGGWSTTAPAPPRWAPPAGVSHCWPAWWSAGGAGGGCRWGTRARSTASATPASAARWTTPGPGARAWRAPPSMSWWPGRCCWRWGPAALELSLRAVADAERERGRLARQWEQRLERARYDTERAARQYHAAEPEHRLVARELERRWERALLAQRQVEDEHDRFLHGQPAGLMCSDVEMIRSLAEDLPALWRAPTTTVQDHQVVIRHLVERVVVAVQGETEWVDVAVHWAGGFVSRHEVRRPVRRVEQLRDYPALMGRVAELHAAGRTSGEVADALNREGFRPPKRRATYNAAMVQPLLARRGRSGPRPRALTDDDPRGDGEWWLSDLARELGMPQATLHTWVRRGWVRARKLPGAGGRWVLRADTEELDRLRRLRACPRGWPDQPYPPELTTPR